MSIEIDYIAKSDLGSLALLYKQLSKSQPDMKRMGEVFDEIVKDNNYHLLGIKINEELAGSLMAIVCRDLVKDCRLFVVIENVVISESFRKQGLGRKLMNYVENMSKQLNCYYIMFVSGFDKYEAHHFYHSLGYSNDQVKGFKKYL
jgi:GNAT superfamily N-acetyltransferase